jgi:hypothetical protein
LLWVQSFGFTVPEGGGEVVLSSARCEFGVFWICVFCFLASWIGVSVLYGEQKKIQRSSLMLLVASLSVCLSARSVFLLCLSVMG